MDYLGTRWSNGCGNYVRIGWDGRRTVRIGREVCAREAIVVCGTRWSIEPVGIHEIGFVYSLSVLLPAEVIAMLERRDRDDDLVSFDLFRHFQLVYRALSRYRGDLSLK